MDLVLVGLPGSGKSAVGRRVASRHGAVFIDLDDQIERVDGRSIPEIFEQDGEAGFRRLERAAVASLGPPDTAPGVRRVISPGGGAIIDPRNRWDLYRGRLPVWLDVRAEVLTQRLRRSPTVRPLIQGADPLGRVRQLAAARAQFYGAASRVNARADAGNVVDAVEQLVASGIPSETTLLRASTKIGDVVIGEGIAARAVGETLRRLAARRAILVSEPGAWTAVGAGIAADLEAAGWPVETLHAAGRRGRRSGCRSSRTRRERSRACGSSARSHSWRSAAAPSGTRRGSSRRPTCGASPGSVSRRRSSPRWIRPSAGRPAWTCPRARTSSVRSTTRPRSSWTSPSCGHSPSGSSGRRWARSRRWRRSATRRCSRRSSGTVSRSQRGDAGAFAAGAVAEIVERSAWAKVGVVSGDEREGQRRRRTDHAQPGSHGRRTRSKPLTGSGRCCTGRPLPTALRAAVRIGVAIGVTPPDRAARIERLLDLLDLGRAPLPYPARGGARRHDDRQEAPRRAAALGPADGRRGRRPRRRARRGRARRGGIHPRRRGRGGIGMSDVLAPGGRLVSATGRARARRPADRRAPNGTTPRWSLPGSGTGSTSWTRASSRCSTSGRSSAARPAGRRRSRAGGRSAIPSASARCCCASRWRTAAR